MKNREEMLFNTKTASEIVGKPIKTVQEWANTVWVKPYTGRPTLISKKVFYAKFVTDRQERSRGLRIMEQGKDKFLIHNPLNSNRYVVELKRDQVICTCPDYQNQIAVWGRGVCKHGYKVLAHKGFSSLKEYQSSFGLGERQHNLSNK